jgi:hypothetical protein
VHHRQQQLSWPVTAVANPWARRTATMVEIVCMYLCISSGSAPETRSSPMSHVVAGPGRDGERQAACGRRAVAGDKWTKFVNTAGDDCERPTHVLCSIQCGFTGDRCCPVLGTYIAYRIEQCLKAAGSHSAGGTGSGRKPRADPDEATYVADQGHAGADCQAAAFQVDPGSADYRVIVARVLGFVVSRIPEERKGKR